MRRLILPLVVLAGLFALVLSPVRTSLAGRLFAPPQPTTSPQQSVDVATQIEQALQNAVKAEQNQVLGYMVNQVQIGQMALTADQTFAVLWLGMSDPNTGEPIPSEPGLAFASRPLGQADWQIILPSDPTWADTLQAAPSEVLPPDMKAVWTEQRQVEMSLLPTAPLTGYLLPWAQGETRYLSQSVLHDKYTPSGSAHYAFDFYLSGQMWNIYAAKGGTVWRVKYDITTCLQPTCSSFQPLGNYIVLQDTTTVPTSYQLYLHLAKDSIPPALRVIGAPVLQGQLLGIADNTGQSWGHHLHFQVHTNPNSYWGNSVDITFADVDINGGRPRVKTQYYDDQPYCKSDPCSQFRSAYVSQNVVKGDLTAPLGALAAPHMGDTLNTPVLALNGWALDSESGFYSAQFEANYNNAWHEIGPIFTSSPFSYSWDLCSAGVPEGPVSLAIRLMNREGSLNPYAGLLTFTNNYTCPEPPPCQPGPDQVALFEDPNYQGCVTYGVGDYPNGAALGALGDNDAAAIKVGANVQATLWAEDNYHERGTTFFADDPNFSDNVIGAETASSMRVQPKTVVPFPPVLQLPLDNSQLHKGDVIVFKWDNGGGAKEYQVQVSNQNYSLPPNWQEAPYLKLSDLDEGTYIWTVRTKNSAGESAWSEPRLLQILPHLQSSGTVKDAPYYENFDASADGWQGTGFWTRKTDSTGSSSDYRWWFQNTSGNYSATSPVSGTLTSPPIRIDRAGLSLRYSSYHETEPSLHWDQRWLQISVDGGPFADIPPQWSDDPQRFWVKSQPIDLSTYAGHTIRIRFAFYALDSILNSTQGWAIDNVSIQESTPLVCNDPHEPNNDPNHATLIQVGNEVNGTICPQGDVDFFEFDGTAGMTLVADIDAQTIGSSLDGVLYLLDGNDGVSQLAMHDDEVYNQKFDPHLAFRLPKTGRYYLKLIEWTHPEEGGNNFFYTLRLLVDSSDPSGQVSIPSQNQWLPTSTFDITANATDPDSGVSHVDFLYHSNQWQNTNWIPLGSDTDGSDGWSWPFNPASYPEQIGLAFYAKIYDWGNNQIGSGLWNLGLDRTAPTSSQASLPATQASTAIHLSWSAFDALSGVDHLDLQVNPGNGWQDLATGIPPNVGSYWFVGQPGHSYAFRMRAVDLVGNLELYPSSAEASTTISASLCPSPQPFEPDDSWTRATPLGLDQAQTHSICNTQSFTSGLNDQDWFSLPVQAGKHYQIFIYPASGDAALQATLNRLDQSNLIPLISKSATAFGERTYLTWNATQAGTLYLQVRHIDGNVAGNDVRYQIQFIEGYRLWMPVVAKK